MNKNAFTLAEVLITLGIIGVVAAMTMPTLMNSTQGAQYKTAFKKSLSAFSQAVTLNMALDDWNFYNMEGSMKAGEGEGAADVANASATYTLEKMFTDRMNVIKKGTIDSTSKILAAQAVANQTGKIAKVTSSYRQIALADGIVFYYDPKDAACTENKDSITGVTVNKCYAVIDVNGEKGPNKYVSCDEPKANIMDDAKAADLKDAYDATKTCTVSNPTDIYPVYYYDQTVVPASAAAKAVLYGK